MVQKCYISYRPWLVAQLPTLLQPHNAKAHKYNTVEVVTVVIGSHSRGSGGSSNSHILVALYGGGCVVAWQWQQLQQGLHSGCVIASLHCHCCAAWGWWPHLSCMMMVAVVAWLHRRHIIVWHGGGGPVVVMGW